MRIASLISAGLALLLASSGARAQDDAKKCKRCKKETYGTTIKWEGSASEAAIKAKKEKKLAFILHVSGHFEDPKFT